MLVLSSCGEEILHFVSCSVICDDNIQHLYLLLVLIKRALLQ